MNKVFLIGNLTRDPELTETASGISVCRFSIAVNRRKDSEQVADFYNVTAWRGLGETVAKYARKGNKIAVCGNIELRKYEDREGIERTAIDIIAQDIEFLTPKADGESENSRGSEKPAQTGKKPFLQAFDDDSDIPF